MELLVYIVFEILLFLINQLIRAEYYRKIDFTIEVLSLVIFAVEDALSTRRNFGKHLLFLLCPLYKDGHKKHNTLRQMIFR